MAGSPADSTQNSCGAWALLPVETLSSESSVYTLSLTVFPAVLSWNTLLEGVIIEIRSNTCCMFFGYWKSDECRFDKFRADCLRGPKRNRLKTLLKKTSASGFCVVVSVNSHKAQSIVVYCREGTESLRSNLEKDHRDPSPSNSIAHI